MNGEPAWIDVAGGRLPFWQAGTGQVMLFVHGWTLDARAWAPQMAAPIEGFQAVAFDRRGFGRATAPPDPQFEVADLLAILDELGADRAVVVGMSQGARAALALAAEHPQRIAALVLAGAPFPYTPPTGLPPEAAPIVEMRALARAGEIAALRALWAASPLVAMPGASEEAGGLLAEIIADYDGRDLRVDQPALDLAADAIAAIVAPALLLVGESDSAMRHAAADALAAAMPNARSERIARAGHLCSLSHPAAFNHSLEQFLRRI